MNPVPQIRREKVFIPSEMTAQEITEKYDLPKERAWKVKRQGFFVKNYSKKQVIIDKGNVDPAVPCSTAKRVYWKPFSWNSVAQSLKEDLIQEAVTRIYENSSLVKERSNGEYSLGYQYFWVAHNAMLSYLKTISTPKCSSYDFLLPTFWKLFILQQIAIRINFRLI